MADSIFKGGIQPYQLDNPVNAGRCQGRWLAAKVKKMLKFG